MTPPNSEELLALAARCEAATVEQQYAVMGDAAYAVWGDEADAADKAAFWDRATRFVAMLRAGAYESAALMLVPEGRVFRLIGDNPGRCKAGVSAPGIIELRTEAATTALALCAAALRAKAANR